MSVVKRGKKHAVVHCHGKDEGKTIATHETKGEALAQHRAIEANKHKHKHHSAPEGSFLEERKRRFGIE